MSKANEELNNSFIKEKIVQKVAEDNTDVAVEAIALRWGLNGQKMKTKRGSLRIEIE